MMVSLIKSIRVINIGHREADNCHILILTLISLSEKCCEGVVHTSRFISSVPPLLNRAWVSGRTHKSWKKRDLARSEAWLSADFILMSQIKSL